MELCPTTELKKKRIINLWVDASFVECSRMAAWGGIYREYPNGSKHVMSGNLGSVQNSTLAEILGLYEAIKKTLDSLDYRPEVINAHIDCKSVVDLITGQARPKDLQIGRVLIKIKNSFGDILNVTHVKGHTPTEDRSENSIRNREVHNLATTALKNN